MKKNWILFVASRYMFKGRGNSVVLSVLGISTGVLALIVIIAVMNGFQLGFIESILEISSYHLRIGSVSPAQMSMAEDALDSIPQVRAVVPFKEFQALARGRRSGQQAVLVRGVPHNILAVDTVLGTRLDFQDGGFDLSLPNSVLIGSELSRRLGLSVGDYITIYSIAGIFSASEEGGGIENLFITGIFRTGFYEYDNTWTFVNIQNENIFAEETDTILGVKLYNRFHDNIALEQAKKRMSLFDSYDDIKFSSWRDYNRSFFGALRTEKLFMFILVGLIFIVVGLNIFQSQRRAVLQRREEIGLLRAVGGSENSVRFVFVCDGAIIGFSGAGIGLLLGLIIANNIPAFFSGIEHIVNKFIYLINILAGYFGADYAGNFTVFSPAIFYIKEIPSRVLVHEVVIIFMFGFVSALAAAWFASGKISKINPAEVLRYE